MAGRSFRKGLAFVALCSSAAVAQAPLAPDAQGNRIPDFSEAGFGRVGEAIPNVPVVARVARGGSAEIQRAIDAVSRRAPDRRGLRGAILLGPETFRLDAPLVIGASGVVLRGTVTARGRTTLVATRQYKVLVTIEGRGRRQPIGPKIPIRGAVPVGAHTVTLAERHGLRPGDAVAVQRPFTAAWIASIGMDRLPPRRDGNRVKQWTPDAGIVFERRVVAVSGPRVTLDAPITDRLRPGEGASLWRYSFAGRIERSGVESLALRGLAIGPRQPGDTPVRDVAIRFDRVTDAWARDIMIDEFASFVDVARGASDVTIDGVRGRRAGPARADAPPTIFSITGQRTLVQNCAFSGDDANVWGTQARAAGPNVFRRCTARGNRLGAGPHQRWGTGTLYEGLDLTGRLVVRNRMSMGSGHGWAGASQVIWNSDATRGVLLEAPPGSPNWAVGTGGRRVDGGDSPGTVVSAERKVAPLSLFDAQVAAALRR